MLKKLNPINSFALEAAIRLHKIAYYSCLDLDWFLISWILFDTALMTLYLSGDFNIDAFAGITLSPTMTCGPV